MPDFLPVAELAAKSVRDAFSAVGALVHALIPPVKVYAAADALADREAEEDVAEAECNCMAFGDPAFDAAYCSVHDEATITEPALSVCPCEALEDSCCWCEDAIDIEGDILSEGLKQCERIASNLLCGPMSADFDDDPMVADSFLRYNETPAAGAVSIAVEEGSPATSPHVAGDAPTWVEIVIPAITDVLSTHQPSETACGIECLEFGYAHDTFADMQEWREHVAPLIAARLEDVTLALPEDRSNGFSSPEVAESYEVVRARYQRVFDALGNK